MSVPGKEPTRRPQSRWMTLVDFTESLHFASTRIEAGMRGLPRVTSLCVTLRLQVPTSFVESVGAAGFAADDAAPAVADAPPNATAQTIVIAQFRFTSQPPPRPAPRVVGRVVQPQAEPSHSESPPDGGRTGCSDR